MEDILVYSSNYEIEKGNWGFRWVGIYKGKRFSVFDNRQAENILINEGKQEYIINGYSQMEMLPEGIQKVLRNQCLSNKYFCSHSIKDRFISIDVFITLLENGNNVSDIEIKEFIRCEDKGKFMCKYFSRESKKLLATIQCDGTVIFEGDD